MCGGGEGGAPGWIVSFSDMVTNLMTFFILLGTFATKQEAGLISDGIGSFRSAVYGGGSGPGVIGGESGTVDLGHARVRYRAPDSVNSSMLEEQEGDITDSNRDSLRDAAKNALKRDAISRIPMEIIFDLSDATLSDAHKRALDVVGPMLRPMTVRLRIDGYAYAEPCDDIRSMALRRAEAVREYLVKAHKIDAARIDCIGFGSSGMGAKNRPNRIVQDYLGRRIAYINLLPTD